MSRMLLNEALSTSTTNQLDDDVQPQQMSFEDPFLADFDHFQAFTVRYAADLDSWKTEALSECSLSSQDSQGDTRVARTNPARRGRVLTPTDVAMIYQIRMHKTCKTAAFVAAKYNITPKAVRDIWTRKTWVHITEHF